MNKFMLLKNLMNCVDDVLFLVVNQSYDSIEKNNLINVLQLHIKILNNALEVLKHEKNASESEKK